MKYRIWSKADSAYVNNDRNFVLSQNGKIRALGGSTFLPEMGMVPEFCSGLKDKNGTDIYEGDVIVSKAYRNDGIGVFNFDERAQFTLNELKGEVENVFTSELKFDEGGFYVSDGSCECVLSMYVGDMRHSQPIFELEVIGNIHESPDLLK